MINSLQQEEKQYEKSIGLLLFYTGTYDKKVIDRLKTLKVRRSYNFLEIMDID